MTRIGVAIAVPDPWGARLQEYRRGLGDGDASGIPTHITLVPPYQIEEDELGAVEQHLAEASTATPPFAVRLRGTGTFRPVSPVVFVNVVEGIGGCELLEAGMRAGPLDCDREFPFHPHVTVAHLLDDDLLDRALLEMADFGCTFEVDRFALWVFHEAEGWVPTRDYQLDRATLASRR